MKMIDGQQVNLLSIWIFEKDDISETTHFFSLSFYLQFIN